MDDKRFAAVGILGWLALMSILVGIIILLFGVVVQGIIMNNYVSGIVSAARGLTLIAIGAAVIIVIIFAFEDVLEELDDYWR